MRNTLPFCSIPSCEKSGVLYLEIYTYFSHIFEIMLPATVKLPCEVICGSGVSIESSGPYNNALKLQKFYYRFGVEN